MKHIIRLIVFICAGLSLYCYISYTLTSEAISQSLLIDIMSAEFYTNSVSKQEYFL